MNHRQVYPRAILALLLVSVGAVSAVGQPNPKRDNPFLVPLNEPVAYARVTAEDLTTYAQAIMDQASTSAEAIRNADPPTLENVVDALDQMYADIDKASSNSWMLYWVSPDSLTRAAGLAAYERLDSLNTSLYSDKAIFDKVKAVEKSETLNGVSAKLVADLIRDMRHTGVDLEPDDLEVFRTLRADINDLTSQYSTNMNTDVPVLSLDEAGASGLPEAIKIRYRTDDGIYEIPVINANNSPVLNNAVEDSTRMAYYEAYNNRASQANLAILDQLVAKRYELAAIMGYDSFAGYQLELRMAKDPENVWNFLNDLIERTAPKAARDLEQLRDFRAATMGAPRDAPMNPWDIGFLFNSIRKSRFDVDLEKIREYFPLEPALEGMMQFYQQLLGLEFRRVEHPSVWHEEVEFFEVYEEGNLVGRFYLDLFPRPNKESWFYGVSISPGSARRDGYEVPVSLLLANFTRPSGDRPSLVSHGELRILFHEFGHIVDRMSFRGRYALQNESLSDFVEAMSQIFENWIWDYDVLSSFARHYKTGEVLPKETFDRMLAAKNLGSGLAAQRTLERAVYDMTLYDRDDPEHPVATDDIWRSIGHEFVLPGFVEGTHPQASWIHINTHPVYYYGYLWSDVYAQDMFTQFEKNGLRDTATGKRYRELILANGKQRPIEEMVEAFLGRPVNNEAYIRSLGLEETEN